MAADVSLTYWGRKDLFEPVMRLFNLAQLMDAEDQRQVARVAISAFLGSTLRDETGYRALFRDPRWAQAWLPGTLILSRYQDSAMQFISTYEEDVVPTTTTLPGGALDGDGLIVWREGLVAAKWETSDNHVALLGWDHAASGDASYSIRLPAQAMTLSQRSALVFALSDANMDPSPDDGEPWPAPASRSHIDLTVELTDDRGVASRLPLSHVSRLTPQLAGKLGKADFMTPLPDSEVVLQPPLT